MAFEPTLPSGVGNSTPTLKLLSGKLKTVISHSLRDVIKSKLSKILRIILLITGIFILVLGSRYGTIESILPSWCVREEVELKAGSNECATE